MCFLFFWSSVLVSSWFTAVLGLRLAQTCVHCRWEFESAAPTAISTVQSDSKWCQKHKMAALIPGIFWLHCCTMKGSWGMLSIFYMVYGADRWFDGNVSVPSDGLQTENWKHKSWNISILASQASFQNVFISVGVTLVSRCLHRIGRFWHSNHI